MRPAPPGFFYAIALKTATSPAGLNDCCRPGDQRGLQLQNCHARMPFAFAGLQLMRSHPIGRRNSPSTAGLPCDFAQKISCFHNDLPGKHRKGL
jgi:hypothetical protein